VCVCVIYSLIGSFSVVGDMAKGLVLTEAE
jgi:hypothetical protein